MYKIDRISWEKCFKAGMTKSCSSCKSCPTLSLFRKVPDCRRDWRVLKSSVLLTTKSFVACANCQSDEAPSDGFSSTNLHFSIPDSRLTNADLRLTKPDMNIWLRPWARWAFPCPSVAHSTGVGVFVFSISTNRTAFTNSASRPESCSIFFGSIVNTKLTCRPSGAVTR